MRRPGLEIVAVTMTWSCITKLFTETFLGLGRELYVAEREQWERQSGSGAFGFLCLPSSKGTIDSLRKDTSFHTLFP